jgi:hypothetical protein
LDVNDRMPVTQSTHRPAISSPTQKGQRAIGDRLAGLYRGGCSPGRAIGADWHKWCIVADGFITHLSV